MDTADAYVELLKRGLLDLLNPTTSRAVRQRDGSTLVEQVPEHDRGRRLVGGDWPANAASMVGYQRLTNVERCVRTALADGVPGDLIETGVWRGGATILMRAMLDVLGDETRRVWVADSFAGLPAPDEATYPADAGDRHHTYDFLTVSEEEVRRNFERYDLLDKRVRFLPGWFSDTLPGLGDETWAVLRLDGDMYGSTMQALQSLYANLSPGGFVIIDDYGAIPNCARAVEDFREAGGIEDPLEKVDWTGVFWRKGEPATRRRAVLTEPAREFTKVYWQRRQSTWANTYWRGVPVQKLALDLWVLQEIIQSTRPGVVLETGTKFGGSAAYLADLLQLAGGGRVISVDLCHDPLDDTVRGDPRIDFIEGDSADAAIIDQVHDLCGDARVMVVLDSDHRARHVRAELDAYAGLVANGCYLVVEDTIVNGNPILPDFGPGPGEAVAAWIETHPEFEVDRSREHLMATFHPGGYLRRV